MTPEVTSEMDHELGRDGTGVGRRRLLAAMKPRATRAQLLAAILCAVLGFALVVQVHQNQAANIGSLRQSDLIRYLGNVTQNSARLDDEARRLEQQRARLQSGSDRSAAAKEAAEQRLHVLGILAGTEKAQGPGIRLEIFDPAGKVVASTLLDATQELRDAGAEAIQIGDARIIVSSAFTDAPDRGGIQIGDQVVRPPYRFLAIGDSVGLETALRIPGGVVDALQSQGASSTITPLTTVQVFALRTLATPQYARPAPAATP